MSEIIERATKAAWDAMSAADPMAYMTPLAPLLHWSEEALDMVQVSPAGCKFDGEVDMNAVVLAVIGALREPTEAMTEACNRAAFAQGGGAIVLRPVWEAMIDSALTA